MQIAYTKQNALDLYDRYFGKIADFLTDIVGMDLDDWQRDVCELLVEGEDVRVAVSSGHSSGKSALMSGLNIYFITFHSQPKITVTANTKNQLTNKTWRELAVWHQRSLVRDWFVWTATKFYLKSEAATWFAEAIPWSEHNSEAFAGDHEKYMLLEYDEASSIPEIIFEVSEGATAKPGGFRWWLIFGNPTQNSGAFYDRCFGRLKHRWNQVVIDTRKCKYADQEQIKKWIEDYGLDSDFVRVRVLGLPPIKSLTTLIPQIDVDRAIDFTAPEPAYRSAPNILGVDCARFGDDETVIAFRQGVKLHWLRAFNGLDEMEIANEVYKAIKEVKPDAVFFDNTGNYGIGAYDRLKHMGHDVFSVNFSSKKAIEESYYNKRAEMWGRMREWLAGDVDLCRDSKLPQELVVVEYFYNIGNGSIQLEKKRDCKKRIGYSPDRADAVALTFAERINPNKKKFKRPVRKGRWS